MCPWSPCVRCGSSACSTSAATSSSSCPTTPSSRSASRRSSWPTTTSPWLTTRCAASTPASTGLYSRENSPYSEFVNNGPTRIAMPYRVPDPVLPPWVTSTASMTSSTEHVYAMPARVIRSSEESVERDPRSVGSLVSLNAQWKSPTDPR